jgi:hypothetical protein
VRWPQVVGAHCCGAQDWDSAGKNDLQGEAEVTVTKLEPDKRMEIWADLIHPSLPQKGQVHLFVEV